MKILFKKLVFNVEKIIFIVKAFRFWKIFFFLNDFFEHNRYNRFRIYEKIMIFTKN